MLYSPQSPPSGQPEPQPGQSPPYPLNTPTVPNSLYPPPPAYPQNAPYTQNPPYPPVPMQTASYGYHAPMSSYASGIVAPRPSGLAIASLVTSLISWFILPIIGGIIAVILGHSARSVIRRSNGTMNGGGMALAGLIIGYVQVVVVSIVLLCVFYFIAAFASG